jgi:hypothetical protein
MGARFRSLPLAIRRAATIPLPDARSLRPELRRTTLVRLGLVAALVALGVTAVWRANANDTRTVTFLPHRETAIVVLDESKSIYITAYKRIDALLTRLVAADASVGLVAFSDTAYELLPPGSHGTELQALIRYYRPGGGGAVDDSSSNFSANPWEVGFSAGTKISSGLDLAQEIVHRDRLTHATILLASDLETASEDQPLLTRTLLSLRRDPRVTLRIVPLFPIAEDREFFERLVGKKPFVDPSKLDFPARGEAHSRFLGGTPTSFLVVAVILLLALAVNELTCSRVYIPRPREESA